MSAKKYSNAEDLSLVNATLNTFDPDRLTVVVGSAAIVAQLADYSVESPISCDDVDVLCSQEFFDGLRRTGPFIERGIRKFQVRWPYGRLKERGGTFPAIDIYPDNTNILRFTACTAMADNFYAIGYEDSREDAVDAHGLRCLRIEKILEWISVIGRDKDIQTVEAVLPLATSLGLVDPTHVDMISDQVEVTKQLKKLHPEHFTGTSL